MWLISTRYLTPSHFLKLRWKFAQLFDHARRWFWGYYAPTPTPYRCFLIIYLSLLVVTFPRVRILDVMNLILLPTVDGSVWHWANKVASWKPQTFISSNFEVGAATPPLSDADASTSNIPLQEIQIKCMQQILLALWFLLKRSASDKVISSVLKLDHLYPHLNWHCFGFGFYLWSEYSYSQVVQKRDRAKLPL